MAQVLVIDRIVLQRVDEADEVVRFGNEHAVGRKHLDDAVDDRVHVLDVGKAVGGGDDARRSMLTLDLACGVDAEIALDGRDAPAVGDIADVGRLDAEHTVAAVLEIRQQRAVIGTDIDHEIVFAEAEHGGGLALQLGEIVAQQLGGAAGVGIFGREDDHRVDGEAELHQVAARAVQQAGRKPWLLVRDRADRHHLVDRRHVAERQHRGERLVPADLADRWGRLPPCRRRARLSYHWFYPVPCVRGYLLASAGRQPARLPAAGRSTSTFSG